MRASTRVSYFLGNDPARWRSGLDTLEDVSLGEVWPGIVVKLRAQGRSVEKLFTVQPGADASRIRMSVAGARRLRTDRAGALLASTGPGDVTFTAPVAYQERGGVRREIDVAYDVRGLSYGFRLGAHDPALPVVIDPLLQATYLGGSGNDQISGVAIHPTSGEVYVAGATSSTNFPGTTGGAQPAVGGVVTPEGLAFSDAFVARLNATLTTLNQATYLGGSASDAAYALAIHPTSGEVYVTGLAGSTDFPGTTGGAQPASGGGNDVFVARLNAALTTLGKATYLGGSGYDVAYALAIHPTSGEVYVTGYTTSTNFPGTLGGAQAASGGGDDVFVARLNAALTALGQATYLGGNQADAPSGLAIHPSGEVYVTGYTDSPNFPGRFGGAQDFLAGVDDAFVARLNAALTTLGQATYLGGNFSDGATALAIHPGSGEVYVAGSTNSTNFPGTTGGAQAGNGGGFNDAFVARLNAALTSVGGATYLGGSGSDVALAMAIQPTSGSVYVTGSTESTNFPGTAGGAQAASGGGNFKDAFVARLNAALTTLRQATYLGGSDLDRAFALAIHPTSGELYAAGGTFSTNFPGTTGGAQPAYGGGFTEAFVARLTADLLFRAQGDFDGNGSIDILWRNVSTGENTIWRMSGNNVIGFGAIPTIPDQSWQIGGVGDLSGDGLSDIVWRNNTTGQNTIWVMNGAALASQAPLPPVGDVNWRIRAIADFNGDGKADLLWRNIATGANTVWFMNGSAVTGVAPVPTVVDVNWEIDGAADFDGDGKPDILWRNLATGQNTLWLMNGTVVKSLAAVPPVTDLNWRIGGVGDYTGDAQPDILWRNIATGQNTVWTMSTTQVVGAIPVPSVPDLNWRIAGPR